jgi:hypothetical protein
LALRAGGYNILPCDDVIRTMRKYGIILDSSVYNGGYEHGYLSRYDFRTVKDTLGYWSFSGDVRKADAGGDLYELPVLALPMRR